MPNDCILLEIYETKSTTFVFMRNEAVHINLVEFLKYMAESFDNMKFQHTWNAAIFRPPNSYILHYNGECGLFTMIWKEMVSKNLNLEKIKFYTCTL